MFYRHPLWMMPKYNYLLFKLYDLYHKINMQGLALIYRLPVPKVVYMAHISPRNSFSNLKQHYSAVLGLRALLSSPI